MKRNNDQHEDLSSLWINARPDLQLNSAEERLLREIAKGSIVDFSVNDLEVDAPKHADSWGSDRTIPAQLIEWLLTAREVRSYLPHHGLRIRGARIEGTVDAQYSDVTLPVEFEECLLTGEWSLEHSTLKALNLSGSHITSLTATGADIKGDVVLTDGFKAEGEVRLFGATIGGQLNCDKGEFHNPEGYALNANGADIKGDVFLRDGFKVEGEVRLLGATIGGQLNCEKGEFHNPEGYALSADQADIKGSVFLTDSFKAEGEVRLAGASIGGQLNCDKGEFHNPEGYALNADQADIKNDVFLTDGFKAEGEVRLAGASIGGQLNCDKGEFHNPEGYALNANGADIKGSVFLREGFKVEGEVRLLGATIGGQLNCEKGEFHNPEGYALSADQADIKGSVFLTDGFKVEGEVRLLGATIGGQLNCEKGEFHNPEGIALYADGADIKNDVFLTDGFKAEGEVRLLGATIGGQLNCEKGEFHNPEGYALSADQADIKGDVFLTDGFKVEGEIVLAGVSISGWLVWRNVRDPKGSSMDLRGAKAGMLWHDKDSWPAAGNLRLHGFCYEDLADEAPRVAKQLKEWLRLQPKKAFFAQPYEQLANVLREKGDDSAAKKIQIAKNVDRRRRGTMPLLARPVHWLLGVLTGYGYKPWRPLAVALLLVGIGWGLFHAGGREGIIQKVQFDRFASAEEHAGNYVQPNLHPLLYSFDAFLPVISFGHTEHWAADEQAVGLLLPKIPLNGLALNAYKWFLNVAGWILATLFITTITGTISKRL